MLAVSGVIVRGIAHEAEIPACAGVTIVSRDMTTACDIDAGGGMTARIFLWALAVTEQ